MKLKVDTATYENRVEVTIPLPDGVESVEGGAQIFADEDGSNRRAVWCFAADADVTSAATEAARLLVASSPGEAPEPAAEEPSSSETVTVSL